MDDEEASKVITIPGSVASIAFDERQHGARQPFFSVGLGALAGRVRVASRQTPDVEHADEVLRGRGPFR